MNDRLHRSQFIDELKEVFPELRRDINSEMGQLVFEIDIFRRFTQAKIDCGEVDAAKRCFSIAQKYYLTGNRQLREVIDTCYVEDLVFQDSKKTRRDWAWACFPTELKEAYTRFHGTRNHR